MITLFRGAAPRVLVLLLITGGTLVSCSETAPDRDDAPASSSASPATDRGRLRESGIGTTPVRRAVRAESVVWAYGIVIDASDLAAARSQWESARSQRETGAARLAASTLELERLQSLFADNRNVSARSVEDARAVAAADRAAVVGAEAAMSGAEAALIQRWGGSIARAVIADASWARDVLLRRAVLIEVALPPSARPPQVIELQTDDGGRVKARFVSRSVRVDPRLQRPTTFFLARDAALPAGITLVTQIAGTSASAGSLIPRSAVVWHDGQAFAFVEQPDGKYLQTAVDASHPVADGFVDPHIVPGTRVVIRGAQQLLSERNQPATAGAD